MNRIFYIIFLLLLETASNLFAQNISFEQDKAIEILDNKLFRIKVLMQKKSLDYLDIYGDTSNNAKVKRYRESIADSQVVSSASKKNSFWRIDKPQSNFAYYIESDNSLPYYIYIIDYNDYKMAVNSLSIKKDEKNKCTKINIDVDGNIKDIYYYTADAGKISIDREIEVEYEDLIFDNDIKDYKLISKSDKVEYIDNKIQLNLSLKNTKYTIKGDRFSKLLNIDFEDIASDEFPASRLSINPIIESDDIDNMDFANNISAPLNLRVKANGNNDAISRYSWSIYKIENKEEKEIFRLDSPDFEHRILNSGNYKIRLKAIGRDPDCVEYFEKNFGISESLLEVPNAFSPYGSEGVNDVFRVKARSLVRFDAYIYSKEGQEIYHWTDVNGFWDGTFNGRKVLPGVYYYVIVAEGSDGKTYDKKGTISILGEYIR